MVRAAVHWFVPALLGLLLGVVFLANLGTSSIWDSNEAFYTETPREMMEQGSLVVPFFNYRFRMNKPPLSYWVVIIAYKALGVSVLAQRLCGILFLAALLLTVWRLMRLLAAEAMFRWAAVLITAFTPRIFIMGRRALIEIMIAFFVTAALDHFIRFYRERKTRSLVFFYLCLGLGFLTKGPVALVLPGGVIALFLLFRRDLRFWRALRPLAGAGILALLILPWCLGVWAVLSWDYLLRFFYWENVMRYSGADFGPSRGVFYYPGVLLGDFSPWVILLPPALWGVTKSWAELAREEKENILFLLIWLVFPIVFFSLSANKQEYYIMPAYPAGAMLVALGAQALCRERRAEKFWRWSLLLVCLWLMAVGIAAGYLSGRWLDLRIPGAILAGVAILLPGAGICWSWRKRWLPAGAAILGTLFCGYLFYSVFLVPRLEMYRPVRSMARIILARAGPADRVGYFGVAAPSLCFYTRRSVLEFEKQAEFLRVFDQPFPFYCVIPRHDLAVLDKTRRPYRVLAERPLFSTGLKYLVGGSKGGPIRTLCLIVSCPPGETGGPGAAARNPG